MSDPLFSLFAGLVRVAADLDAVATLYRRMPRPVQLGCQVASAGSVGYMVYFVYNYQGSQSQQKSMKEASERY